MRPLSLKDETAIDLIAASILLDQTRLNPTV